MRDYEGRDVDEKPERRDDQHQPAQHRLGREEARDGLPGDPPADDEEGEPVDEGDEHLRAIEPVGTGGVGRAPCETEGQPGQHQRGEVREHVAGVGEKCERAREDAAGDLGQHEDADEDGCDGDPALARAMCVVVCVAVTDSAMCMTAVVIAHGSTYARARPRTQSGARGR